MLDNKLDERNILRALHGVPVPVVNAALQVGDVAVTSVLEANGLYMISSGNYLPGVYVWVDDNNATKTSAQVISKGVSLVNGVPLLVFLTGNYKYIRYTLDNNSAEVTPVNFNIFKMTV